MRHFLGTLAALSVVGVGLSAGQPADAAPRPPDPAGNSPGVYCAWGKNPDPNVADGIQPFAIGFEPDGDRVSVEFLYTTQTNDPYCNLLFPTSGQGTSHGGYFFDGYVMPQMPAASCWQQADCGSPYHARMTYMQAIFFDDYTGKICFTQWAPVTGPCSW